ncbi:MlaD family protein [Sulfurimonas sp. C5]|uniref:MlaD family protein n=1 Tax=Sulfurimonas sp. C5 TaxID=3036947 RepID=UPI002458FCD0|nr:MlaD family protein [Sulfurimonas sp. C5]MDH4944964.1 MlaD family protein [Sulfurimonas sp. C5]
MNNKVNYTLVGFIVLLGLMAVLVFSYWMLKPTQEEEVQHYVIYFDESVFGLNLDAPVKFRGISVGKVSNLRINPNNSEQVEVQVTIKKSTPIKDNIVAVLTAQGITGLTYVNLTVGDNHIQEVVKIAGKDYYVIATAPSIFQNVQKSFGDVSDRLTETLYQTEKLLSDENQEEFMKLISATSSVVGKLDKALDAKTIKHFQNTMANLDIATDKVSYLVDKTAKWEDNVSASLRSIKQSYLKIDSTMTEFKTAMKDGQFNFKEISSEVIPSFNSTLLELQESLLKFDNAIKEYERSPSDFLFKREATKKAPGE